MTSTITAIGFGNWTSPTHLLSSQCVVQAIGCVLPKYFCWGFGGADKIVSIKTLERSTLDMAQIISLFQGLGSHYFLAHVCRGKQAVNEFSTFLPCINAEMAECTYRMKSSRRDSIGNSHIFNILESVQRYALAMSGDVAKLQWMSIVQMSFYFQTCFA